MKWVAGWLDRSTDEWRMAGWMDGLDGWMMDDWMDRRPEERRKGKFKYYEINNIWKN